ncbi:acetyl-CoA carboxylase carboxyl transferase subunit alpha [Enterocloster clostridioformis]|uniref:acetyl-CoA carboxylase carboxyltransferase subunit alpha n=1 Tax=Enterocloster clostridioformis TaxID=1531 RepID=UPI00080C397B|nr:acetyl-CoA carboxylase carboxyltransferase subunit alpha [Enterocloster clostridioformis]ANU47120.1 acetyl-CoA carboxylase carboxyl transferase subunit alpha [Lachnoclostridium sp. YL32]NDO32698.1 acetyl-CoA carboxylase carboxyltransferase subunit beta [Enterocloster clostridioformis]OXE62951.1 acetyl-CoA carboxylase carboxyl transferase subunit alpha [Enterocloster clostridioformis]QQQ98178.1 acetyl-CoA carboxylase carboxyltransferase subunit beta [Enterocloster clostridioformis]
MLRNMFKKTYTKIDTKYKPQAGSHQEPVIPEGLWRKCNKCGQPIYVEDVKNNYYVCPKCNGYFRVHAYRRIEMLADEGTFEEWNKEMPFSNPLNFPGYEKKVLAAREKSRLNEAIVTGKCKIDGNPAVVGVCDARFIMSSMGHVVGEKITGAIERATREKMPVILFACSGGARMQEGIVSLMQMAKTSAALKRHHEAGQLFISVLTDPTTGGVTASFAMLGDIILAEPHALIGFAGPRVIEQTIGQKLPEGFQRSEFLLEHGFVDKIVERKDQKRVIGQILYMHRSHKMNIESKNPVETARTFVDKPSESQEDGGKTAWDTVLLSRKSDRPVATDYINALFDEFIEFHGDRYFKDDGAIVGGVAMFHGMPVTVIGQQKGKNTKDNITRNFGMPSPDGYRKALRLMKQAETFGRPVVCFVDTPGAFCGLEAEERGQGEAIARNLFEISDIKVPVLSIVIGEGGSGGALAMAVADEVWMLENAIYSILSPEGFASILYKDSKKAPDAAKVMKVTAKDLLQLKLIERIVPEEQPACTDNLYRLAEYMDSAMAEFFKTYLAMSDEELREHRYQRFRRM